MEIETALASGGGDDEAIEDMIVNSSWKKDGGCEGIIMWLAYFWIVSLYEYCVISLSQSFP